MISDTQTISIDAPPEQVMKVVGDPENLPRWAPDFAQAVRRDGDLWLIDTGEAELSIRVRVSPELGTVDLLAPNAELGAFSRVVTRGRGSEYAFTQFFPDETPDADVQRQQAVVASELETVKDLAETLP